IVHRRDVRARRAADLADGHVLEPAVGEEPGGGLEQPFSSLGIGGFHSVRLNSPVASVIAITENPSRKRRSELIASNPVFFSSRFLNACTAYVNGSMAAITCIHPGNPCCGYTAPLGK